MKIIRASDNFTDELHAFQWCASSFDDFQHFYFKEVGLYTVFFQTDQNSTSCEWQHLDKTALIFAFSIQLCRPIDQLP